MIVIKNKSALLKMETAGKLLAEIVTSLAPLIKPGVTSLEIDNYVAKRLQESNLVSAMKGYMGYKYVTCISVNDVVVHGIPSNKMILRNGDIVKVDVAASWKGYCADMARVFFVGDQVSDQAYKLARVAQDALNKGIDQACVGKTLGDISHAIQSEVERHGFAVVRDFTGHGIGKRMHEDPEILNYGKPGTGPRLCAGMTLALEPMITAKGYEVFVEKDKWTVKTVDGSLAAHVEDTVAITDQGPKIFTRLENEGW